MVVPSKYKPASRFLTVPSDINRSTVYFEQMPGWQDNSKLPRDACYSSQQDKHPDDCYWNNVSEYTLFFHR